MEGVCVVDPEYLEVLERGLARIVRDLAEAVDRTPHTVASRHLIEGSMRMAISLYGVAARVYRECGGV